MPLNKDSNFYIIGFAAAVCVVCSIFVSGAAVSLKEKQKTIPKDHIAVWKHRPNQKRLTYERIKYLS